MVQTDRPVAAISKSFPVSGLPSLDETTAKPHAWCFSVLVYILFVCLFCYGIWPFSRQEWTWYNFVYSISSRLFRLVRVRFSSDIVKDFLNVEKFLHCSDVDDHQIFTATAGIHALPGIQFVARHS